MNNNTWESVNGTVTSPAEEPSHVWDGDKNGPERPYMHDYSQTLTMKLFMAIPDGKGGSYVFINFDETLNLIKQIDFLTVGIPKIIYLVGWNYLGHDDKYPAWDVVNPHLCASESTDAAEDLNRLIKEARAYNTTVSLHINSTDAYLDSPLWDTYKENDLISRRDGKEFVTGTWNNKSAYQVNYKNTWESGMYKKNVDSLLKMLPEVKKSGTIHSDAFVCRYSDQSTLADEQAARRQMIRYWRDLGIDLTGEFIASSTGDVKETHDGNNALGAGLIGLMPYAWHLYQSEEFWHSRPASLLAAGSIRSGIVWSCPKDEVIAFLYGQSMQGENILTKAGVRGAPFGWEDIFIKEFCLGTLLYVYQNKFANVSISGSGDDRSLLKEGNLVAKYSSVLEERIIHKDGILIRQGNDVFAPVVWIKDAPAVIAYSESGYSDRTWTFLPEWSGIKSADISKITKNGLEKVASDVKILDERTIDLTLKANEAVLIVPKMGLNQ
jgi:hypothetical protein